MKFNLRIASLLAPCAFKICWWPTGTTW